MLGALLMAFVSMSVNTLAQHVNLPPVNLGATSFLDGVAGPGLLIEAMTEIQQVDAIKNSGGADISGTRVHSNSGLIHMSYPSKLRIPGGVLGGELVMPLASVRLDLGSTRHNFIRGLFIPAVPA